MKEWLVFASEHAIVLIDFIALGVVLWGTLEALIGSVRFAIATEREDRTRRHVWLRYARWLVAGLTFQLAADILETSITSDWDTIGRIAAVAAVRTFLNYFLDRDYDTVRERQHPQAVRIDDA